MTKKSISRLLQASLMCCLAVLFTACDDIFASEDNPTPAYLSMSDKPVTIKVGDTYRRKAISVITAVVEYTSSDTKVATVDGEGMVTAIAEGEATITATATGYSTGGKKIFQADSKSYKLTVKPATLPAATITTAPKATAGYIVTGSTTALVTAGVADGGTMMYQVTETNAKPTTTDGFSATVPTAANLGVGTYYVWYYAKGNTGYNDSEIAASAVEVTIVPTLSTPLTLEALTAGTIKVSYPQAGMQYSLNGGAKTAVPDGTPIDVAVGDKVAFYGNGTTITSYDGTTITGGTADIKVYGNIMSLVDETNFATNITLTGWASFTLLFDTNAKLTDASGLLLPATTLATFCYYGMFYGCSSLTTAPALPATTLKEYCYYAMFQGCSLTTAPALPATALADNCYNSMFYNCSSLTTAPALPATTLKEYCYSGMFSYCSSLTTAPALPATELKGDCYNRMFYGCSSLTTAYVKAAYTSLNHECYQMFDGCTATGAKLHTTTTNKASWDALMPSTWATWTAVGDWND
ncbi:hypothetical protein PRMUPPPA20_20360 [Xylanibacter ruminicola]|uniref:Ig-like protein n=2 Tax=Xylanibacter ruminicola TaxID=839 RepID=D5ET44_XYLR2|nr:Ig-like domain-containing protein [Xylanibacter ruminicola]ADE83391.1 Ig-like protein [Xylanibacter ruminicola 23]GJG33927.1 hypothetical protein PRMUPPPA20_20360 [Xylanibacter ruminicola]SEH66057.1 Leucine rich repeat-containing protein [Xylanibacter ruminicola]